MKVKENVKTFIEKNKKAIAAGAIVAGASTLAFVGFNIGREITLSDFEKLTNVNFKREFAYNTSEKLIKHFAHDEAMVNALKPAGFTSIDDTLKAVVIIQKK